MNIKILLSVIVIIIISCNKKHESLVSDTTASSLKVNSISQTSYDSITIGNPTTLDKKYTIQQLNNSNGLSNSSVNTIFQDSENLIWIGTWDGLNRYDGNKFKIFRPELDNEKSLSNQVILKVEEDDTGQIWVLTMNGINRYNKKTNTFQQYYFSTENKPQLSQFEFNMTLDRSKMIFCAVKDWGIGYFDGDNFQLLNTVNLPTESVKKMEFMPTGELLVLFVTNELYSLVIETNNEGEKLVSQIKRVSNNSQDQEKSAFYDFKSVSERYMFSDELAYFILDSLVGKVDESWLNQLKSQSRLRIIQGSENVIWVGTDGDGIFKIYPHKKSFNLLSKDKVPEFNGGIVRAFSEVDRNSFWVGTKGKGLFRFPSKFYLNPEEPLMYEVFNESNSTLNNAIYTLCKGQDKLMFIGTDGDGINVFDLEKSKLIDWSEILGSEQCGDFKSVYTIFQDKKGFIWLGTYGYGLIRFKIERLGESLKISQFKRYLASDSIDGTLSSNIIYSIVPKNNNQLWLGTRLGGLNLFDKKSGLFKTYKHKNNNPKSLSNNDILCLYNDAENRLWIGTSLGLNLLEELKNDGKAIFRSFTVKDGLPNNTIHGIVSDKESNLWISTNFGLSNFKINESKFINFTKNEGLQNNEFADGAFYRDAKSDFIFMGGIKGFNYFLPTEIGESTFIPDILINKISGQNQEEPYYQNLVVSPDSDKHPSIVLKHNQNFFDIELAALTYINSEKCQYAYQLNNFDQGWNTISNRRNISFTNVPPGKYSLWLKWSNSDGIWSDPVQAIDIQIKPIFWRSNIAIVIYLILFFLFLLFVLSYYKERQLLKQNIIFQKREEEIHQNRLTFFTNIAHELQTPLTLIVGPSQKLSESGIFSGRNQKFINMIQRNASRLLFLTQQLLEFRKAEYDHLEVTIQQFDLVNLVEQITELFDELALQKNIDYKLELPSKLKGWFDKDKIEKIVFNLLSNAFKYTPENGEIKIRLFIYDNDVNTLNIKVSNTGKGIPKEKLEYVFNRFFLVDNGKDSDINKFRTGIGLAYIKRLVTVLKGEIVVSSKVNKITTFTAKLPCSKDSFNEKELNQETGLVLISHHLKNILEDVSNNSDDVPSKVSSLEDFMNNRKVVLIVEDEKEIHKLLNELLKEKYKILTAYNGVEAMEIIKNNVPDIIISDVMMPEMDGIELCKKIKSDVRTCHIPLILLTAKNSISHRIEGLESGANSYIPKPFHPDHLLIRVQKLLEEKELILKHFAQDTPIEDLSNLPIHSDEKDFISKVIELIRTNIENENLQSSFIEKELGVSSSQLYRKTKQICGFSPGDLIRTIRLKYAAELLQKSSLTVSEVCYQSGFNNRSYFYREFKKMYNSTPKNYQLKYKLDIRN